MTLYTDIKAKITPANVMDLIPELHSLSLEERERLSFETGTRVVYLGDEVPRCQEAEESAALAAAPPGYALSALNGLNIGCGNRLISPFLTPLDISREGLDGGHAVATFGAILCAPDNLPFKQGAIDYIVALHMLEHVADPIGILRYWLSLLKPGGGIGVVLPDWRYAWDARKDHSPFGHKWNSTAEILRQGWQRHLTDCCVLEQIGTIPFKGSFDAVFRKPGKFEPFNSASVARQIARVHHDDGTIDL